MIYVPMHADYEPHQFPVKPRTSPANDRIRAGMRTSFGYFEAMTLTWCGRVRSISSRVSGVGLFIVRVGSLRMYSLWSFARHRTLSSTLIGTNRQNMRFCCELRNVESDMSNGNYRTIYQRIFGVSIGFRAFLTNPINRYNYRVPHASRLVLLYWCGRCG